MAKEINMFTRRSVVGFLIVPMFLASCIARKPDDLTVTQVETTTTREAGIRSSDPFRGGSSDLLRIDMATRTDLSRLADSYGNPILFSVRFCSASPLAAPRPRTLYPDMVTGGGGNIGGSKDSGGHFTYHVLVYLSDDPQLDGLYLPYNLLDYPRDICISTRGGNETGFGYLSNDAVASSAQIRAATSRPQPPA